jgi:hypothetical protein
MLSLASVVDRLASDSAVSAAMSRTRRSWSATTTLGERMSSSRARTEFSKPSVATLSMAVFSATCSLR